MQADKKHTEDEYSQEYEDYFPPDDVDNILDEAKKLDSDKIICELEEGGAIAERLPFYERRSAQLDLMRLIIKGFNNNTLVAAEAGTGVGKSFAYLLPAISFAILNDERIVISTATITLQQQLFEKDIPLVLSALNANIKTVLIKGRGNFICRRRLSDALLEAQLTLDGNDQIKKIDSWAETTKSGAKSDLPFIPQDGIWANICSDSDNCVGMRCPFYENCFVMEMRRRAAEAKILVVNHHLLFADVAARYEGAGYGNTVVMPPYSRVIIDEAHTIENSATSFFSNEWNRSGLLRQISRLYRRRNFKKQGLLIQLQAFYDGPDKSDEWEKATENIKAAALELDIAALELCGNISVFRFVPGRDEIISLRLYSHLAELRKNILFWIEMLTPMIDEISKNEKESKENRGEKYLSTVAMQVHEAKAVVRHLFDTAELCKSFIEYKNNSRDVFWIERRSRRGEDVSLWTKAPIDISEKLKESLFKTNKTVVCASATLTVTDRFDYWIKRCGIGCVFGGDNIKRELITGCFPSPFPYSSSVLLAVPSDAPLPEERLFRDFVNDAIVRLIKVSGGSALILFTSFESLNSAYNYARCHLDGINCLRQGDDDRSRLLNNFISDEKSVLFATDSFWEGVDAPGDTLRLVVLCRLPFKTPNDPIFEARCEAIEKEGKSPFMELSIPEAVMKFRQGFGRLIRRSSDNGVVAVLDGRIIKKRYGSIFLQSLPKTKTTFTDFTSVLNNIDRFYSN
jgi:ATP-dependent DNA helicase DinG